MTTGTVTVGVYGKIGSQPDFLRANAGEFSQAGLDLWFQNAVEALRNERTTLPEIPTGFVLKPPESPDVFVGAFAPSADAAGRLFPLVVFRRLFNADLAETFPSLVLAHDPFVRAAGVVASAGGTLSSSELIERVESLSASTTDGTGPRGNAAMPADGSAQPLFAALDGLPAAVGYALRTFVTACDQAAKMEPTGPATSGAVITVDAPAPTPQVRELWLEMARQRLRWRASLPSFFWTDGPAGRLLVALGQPSPSTLCYLANPRHRASRFWPLRTEMPAAREQAMQALTADQRRGVENPRVSLGDLAAAFAPG